ncbi:hypothetical protein TrVE_jg8395 [Triparma verrucosa]|uniref:Uncharacterized protein n=1 Tax=Triparma verrucosa TaxID=1606542 RepID=A0A9W7CD15_9STRA|nr:hypothetical protein TrVE_jg8395 [Triparma verrucosa]
MVVGGGGGSSKSGMKNELTVTTISRTRVDSVTDICAISTGDMVASTVSAAKLSEGSSVLAAGVYPGLNFYKLKLSASSSSPTISYSKIGSVEIGGTDGVNSCKIISTSASNFKCIAVCEDGTVSEYSLDASVEPAKIECTSSSKPHDGKPVLASALWSRRMDEGSMTGGKDGKAIVTLNGVRHELKCEIAELKPGKYSNERQKALDKQVLVRGVAKDGDNYYTLACGRRGGSFLGRWNLVGGQMKLTGVTCVDDEYPVSQMQVVPSREDGITVILTASVEGLLKTWWDSGEGGELVKFRGNPESPRSGYGGMFSSNKNSVQAHDLPITGICVAHGIDVDAVSVSADHKISRVKVFGPPIVEPKKGGSWSGWFFVLLILMFAIYMKIAVDTFCKGELTDFECLKFFTVDVVKRQISVFDPFKKLLRT